MEGILFVVALALGGACWWLWSEREQYQRENDRLKLENERLKTALNTLQMDFGKERTALTAMATDMAGDFKQYRDGMSYALNTLTSELSNIADEYLPAVEEPKEILMRMTPEQIATGDIPLSHEFTRMLTQVAALKSEAISKLYELGLKLAIGIKRQVTVGTTTPASVKHMGVYLKQMQQIMITQAPDANSPGVKEMYINAFAHAMNEMKKALLNGEEPPSADDIALWTRAFEYAVAHAKETEAATHVAEQMAEENNETEPTSFSVNGHSANGTKKEEAPETVVGTHVVEETDYGIGGFSPEILSMLEEAERKHKRNGTKKGMVANE